MSTTKRFAIAGGGISGLTLAIALRRKGLQVSVYEQASPIKPLGAGLVLAGNAMKALAQIGIDQGVVKAGKVLQKLTIKNQQGSILTETDSEEVSRKFGVINNFAIHRADLHETLLRYLPAETIKLGKTCIDFEQSADGVQLHFQDGSVEETDYVIGCDGIHPVFREKLVPLHKPRYAGYTCWRAVINNIPSTVSPDETSESWGPGKRFGIVPLANNKLYWFACLNAKQNDPAMKAYKITDLITTFQNFHAPVSDILRSTSDDQLLWNDIIDLKPLDRFAFNNIVLVGDAAHATTPNMGQGACMAIEDAAVLANCLSRDDEPARAFQKFESIRLERTKKIVSESWRLGRVAQLEHPLLIRLRNSVVRATPAKVMEKQLKFLYDVSFQ